MQRISTTAGRTIAPPFWTSSTPIFCKRQLATMPPKKTTSSPLAGTKRPAPDNDCAISPPPMKRKAQTAMTKTAVANFFTPASQKPKEPTVWSERSPPDSESSPATLLVAKYLPALFASTAGYTDPKGKRRKIAAFDLDSTLITTASGKQHASDPADWKWWHPSVPARIKELFNVEGYQVVIFTNQGGLTLHPDPKSKAPTKFTKTRVPNFKQKCNAVLNQLGIPITLYAATAKDIFRKPRTGMWEQMKSDYSLQEDEIEKEECIFVGDAGGRVAVPKGPKADFSCSDRNLAANIGIKYLTPEEFFLGEQPREFSRDFDLKGIPFVEEGLQEGEGIVFEKKFKKEVVLFVGPPGAGKSTFFWKHLKPLGYERVNQDSLKSKDKCFKAAGEWLKEGDSVAIDNTNADPEIRSQWIDLAKKHGAKARCVWFKTPPELCEHNDTVRALNKNLNPETRTMLPKLAFNSFKSRFKEPKDKEGFEEIIPVDFHFRGTKEEYEIWRRYWV
ncbi:polynucleotide kinase 3 phosphatase-domain-containing protein [Podospora australis]|uniref:Polynucleotide kinase 3 phosphatase-domain-containing protein n=1 Tax=Podospora australis TaxID=1536484 RepID=A0AAN6WM45_9PEZI|nr:polynucleotide kinase 3 phosphatase-domain-containing protein [Podospora australis]